MDLESHKKISQKKVKKNFSTVGLILVLYVFFTMIIPYTFKYYMDITDSNILKDEIMYYGIYFLFLLVGTVFPFFVLRKFSNIKLKKIVRPVNATFVDLFVQTIVFFTICVALTYVSNILINNIGLEGRLIAGIGLNYDEENLNNYIYIFMLLIVSAIIEEYAFRGVLLSGLSRYGKKFALYSSALIFALAHNNFAEMIPAFAMGVALGKTALRYKSIQPTIVIHILFNVFIYGLCVLPQSIIKYTAYGLAAICILAIYLIFTGKYQKINIQQSKSNGISSKLFFTRFTVIFSMILMIAYTCLVTFIY